MAIGGVAAACLDALTNAGISEETRRFSSRACAARNVGRARVEQSELPRIEATIESVRSEASGTL